VARSVKWTRVAESGLFEGKTETINGVKVYIATPSVDYPKDKALLFLPDVFGLSLVNARVCPKPLLYNLDTSS
jgi:hypothetical protein